MLHAVVHVDAAAQLMLFDALRMHCTELALPPPAQCEVCQGTPA